MKSSLDAATLDAMVSGQDEEGDMEAWDLLLTSSEAADAWGQALERRLRIDGYSQALIAHPWIARFQGTLRTLARTLAASSTGDIEAVREQGFLLGDLGQTAEAPTRLAAPAWGRIETVLVPVGTTVGLRWMREHAGTLHFFYKTSTTEGALPEGLWRLEAGEAPVVLMACEGAGGATALEVALASSKRVTGVLLLEDALSDAEA
ncbi:hypothetical protein OV207_08320 [Corallococcus sp. BB11-1]|uniref:hypothetical protein n=1 Tax=Corallococcus sp. BB11-1 TaxID=2996783 RepID=UPI002271F6CB|nr:hypothetical protein [Corallococcus sp. BB11-1]MCY1031457.1 hypothetical protein [Corallococcus sp. BB11-1]